MVNGTTSLIIVIGTIVLLAALIVAISVLTILGDPVPVPLYSAFTMLIGLMIGTRVTPSDIRHEITDQADAAADRPVSPRDMV